jgi:hypothetical protein
VRLAFLLFLFALLCDCARGPLPADALLTTPIYRMTPQDVDRYRALARVLPQMQDGDQVNVVSTRDGAYDVSHVGLIVIGPDGERNFLDSAEPQVREECFAAFFARSAEREARNAREGRNGQKLAGFKLLRLNQPVAVPPAAPQPRP